MASLGRIGGAGPGVGTPASGLNLDHGRRYGRREAFAAVGVTYPGRKTTHLNTGLSPQNPDGGYIIFITLDKESLADAYDYEDELFEDGLHWVTRRGRGKTIETMWL